jgi:ubiquinone/menaquinone biosynthesis C-methylase UbiE
MSRPAPTYWTDGAAYEAYIGRWSRATAKPFLEWLEVAPQSTWLDIGCGTGALTQAILEHFEPARVDAFDASAEFIDYAVNATPDPRATFRVASVLDLPCASDTFDAVVSALMLNMVKDQPRALSEMTRAAKPGGVVAAYVWDFDGEMQMLRHFWATAKALDPDAESYRDIGNFDICDPNRLVETLRGAGLRDVEARALDTPTRFKDFDDYWSPFLRGNSPAQAHVQSLDDERRSVLRECVRAGLPIKEDGSIDLIARAWAAKGTK